MAGSMRLSLIINADGTAAIQGIERVRGSVGDLDREADRAAKGGLTAVTNQLKSFALTAAAGIGVAELARAFITAATESQRFQASLTAITGSTQAAGAEMEYIRATADKMGLKLGDVATAWISLSAAAKGSALEGQAARDIFESVSLAMGKLGKSSADTQGALLAIEQMISKGVVSAEELRGQLGERLPGAFGAAASAMGVTTAELGKLLESGAITADELLPKLAAELNRLYDNGERVGGLTAEWNRLGNALTATAVATDEATGITELLSAGLQQAADWAQALTGVMTEAGPALAGLGVSLGGWEEALSVIPGYLATIGAALAELPNYNIVIRDGALALEEQGTAWAAVAELVAFVGQSFVDLPDNLRAAVFIILGEIDILKTNFQAGMDQLPLIAEQAWAAIQSAITSAIGVIQLAVAQMVAYVAGQLASLATDMAGVMAQIPEVLDIGGVATSAVASLNDLATSLNSTEASVAALKEEQAALSAQQEQDAQALKGQQEAIVARAEAEIAAIRGVIQYGLEEAEAKKAARQAQAELNVEFARAVADQAALEKQSLKTGAAIAGGAKATSGAVKPTKDLASAKGGAAKASKELEAAQRAETQAMAAATRTVDGLVQKYLPAKAAAQDYQESMAALAKAGEAAGLTQEELSVITQGLAKDQAKAADAARREADAFYAAWAEAVDSLDDTFKGLWRSLITGQGDVLGNLKETVLEWVADLSYQLLLSPLIVPIQGALLGMVGGGAAGVTGTATSMLSGASSLTSLFSTGSTLFNAASSLFSGAAFSGISQGFALAMENISIGGYFGSFGTNMALAGSSASSGSIGTAIGAAAPYAIPAAIAVAAAVAIFNKWQSDQEPRYGTLAAMTGGSAKGLEDNEWGAASGAYVKGSFGLNFGLTDKGSKNMEATELTEVYQALADVSDALAEFFGEDLSSFIEAELQKMSDFGDGLIHLTENEGDLGGAMAALVERIAQAAGRSSEDIGIAFGALVGDLSGTAEEVGEQIQAAMFASALAVELSDRYDDSLGQMLDLTGDITGDVKRLKGYIDQFGASGETSGETLSRLVAQLGVLDTAAQQTATNLEGLSATALLTLSDELVGAFGGVEAATQAQAFYYEQFTTGTEKLVDAIQAAADQIDREIPKLQDELLGLSKDVVKAIHQVEDDLSQNMKDLTDFLPDSVGFWGDVNRRLTQDWLDSIAANADAIDKGSANATHQAVTLWQLYSLIGEGIASYGDTLRELGYDIEHGAEVFLESLRAKRAAIRNGGGEIAPGGGEPITETIPGDPNAAILAKLLDDLPKTRQGFEDLIAGLDLTTEAGRKLYAGLMELLPQFDLLYDGVEAFTDWLLGVDEVDQATRELERVFQDWGLTLPENRDALVALYESGELTTEQMAILGAYMRELGLVFGEAADIIEDGVNKIDLTKLRDAFSELERSAAAERELINEQYQARVDAIAAEREALSAANRAQLEALAKQREAAQEALGAAEAGLSRIQSALHAFRGEAPRTEMERLRALRQLGAWAASGRLPDEDSLDRAITGASNLDAQDFTSEASYRAAQGNAYSALLALEKVGVKQVSDAERQIAAIETASERAQAAYEAQLKALDDQADQAAAWRDTQLEAIDQLLAEAAKQIAILEGTWTETKSIDDALAALNEALVEAGGTPVVATQDSMDRLLPPMTELVAASTATTDEVVALRQEIVTLRRDLAEVSTAQVVPLKAIDERLRKWDLDGLPDSTSETALRAA